MRNLSSPYIVMVLLVSCCFIHVSSSEPPHGLRVLQESKATPTSDATTEAIDFEESEFTRSGSMGFELDDYPGSGANNRHSPHSEGNR
uniref:Uncharacterized protein n=1 Tax=Oryza glaberrima TaxID=4538 RepID=I1R6H3_ORYGL